MNVTFLCESREYKEKPKRFARSVTSCKSSDLGCCTNDAGRRHHNSNRHEFFSSSCKVNVSQLYWKISYGNRHLNCFSLHTVAASHFATLYHFMLFTLFLTWSLPCYLWLNVAVLSFFLSIYAHGKSGRSQNRATPPNMNYCRWNNIPILTELDLYKTEQK